MANMSEQDLFFELSEPDEHVVRSYECTRLRKLLAPETIGRLTVTNRRIIFHSQGQSMTGKSALICEMPVEDAAGISVFVGNSLNWPLAVGFVVLLYAIELAMDALLPAWATSWQLGLILLLPFAAVWIFESPLMPQDLKGRISTSISKGSEEGRGGRTSLATVLPVLKALFFVGLAIFVWGLAHSPQLWYGAQWVARGLVVLGNFALFMALIGRQPSFSLLIGSKSMKGSGIYIPGSSLRSVFGDRTAAESVGGRAAADATTVARELGALLTDIRQLGDLGLQKWQA